MLKLLNGFKFETKSERRDREQYLGALQELQDGYERLTESVKTLQKENPGYPYEGGDLFEYYQAQVELMAELQVQAKDWKFKKLLEVVCGERRNFEIFFDAHALHCSKIMSWSRPLKRVSLIERDLKMLSSSIKTMDKDLALYRLLKGGLQKIAFKVKELKSEDDYLEKDILKIEDAVGITRSELLSELESLRIHPNVRKAHYLLVVRAVTEKDSRNSAVARLSEIQERLSQDLILVVLTQAPLGRLAQELEIKPGLYCVPAVALANENFQSHSDVLSLAGIDEKVLETLLALYGGSAYPTLLDAKLGAEAIESSGS